MTKLKVGDVFTLKAGLKAFHTQAQETLEIQKDVVCVVEGTRETGIGSEDDHFEDCFMVTARYLNADGSYYAEGALMTFAQGGDFRAEFIQADCPVLRQMSKTFIDVKE